MSTLELGGLAKSQVAHTGPGTYVGSQSRSLNHAHLYIVAMHLSGQLKYREALTGLTIGTSQASVVKFCGKTTSSPCVMTGAVVPQDHRVATE